jgi:hypothetical protein
LRLILKAILYPVVVALCVAGALQAWLNGVRLFIVAGTVLPVGLAGIRDYGASSQPAVTTYLLPPVQRAERMDVAAHGVAMRDVEARLQESSRQKDGSEKRYELVHG